MIPKPKKAFTLRLNSWSLLPVAMVILIMDTVHAQEQQKEIWSKLLGKRAPVCVTTPASGPWATKYPFDPAQYGLIKGFSPGTSNKSACIMVYTRTLSPAFMSLASRIESILSEEPGLEWSYVHLFDEKGAQRGGYTVEEVVARIAEIRELAEERELSRLSIGIAANPSATKVGLDDRHDVAIVFLAASKDPKQPATVAWHHLAHTKELDKDALKTVEALLRTAIKRP